VRETKMMEENKKQGYGGMKMKLIQLLVICLIVLASGIGLGANIVKPNTITTATTNTIVVINTVTDTKTQNQTITSYQTLTEYQTVTATTTVTTEPYWCLLTVKYVIGGGGITQSFLSSYNITLEATATYTNNYYATSQIVIYQITCQPYDGQPSESGGGGGGGLPLP
jgi:cytoskeletal protein RodZ